MKEIYIFVFCMTLFFANLDSMQPDIRIELQTLQQELLALESTLRDQNNFSVVEKLLSSMRDASRQFQYKTDQIKGVLKEFEAFLKNNNALSIKEMKESRFYRNIEQGIDELEPTINSWKANLEQLIKFSHDNVHNLNLNEIMKIKKFLKQEIREKIEDLVLYFREVSIRGSREAVGRYIIRPFDAIENKNVYININYEASEGQKERISGITTYRADNPPRKKTFIEILDEYIDFLKNKKKELEHLSKK